MFEGLGFFLVWVMVTLIWLLWRGESENERNENGLGKGLGFSSV